ncbi:hypothetical protein CC117_28490 [Parafrankia colletiae]|uniref:Uncharacterized protein n=1 Tax=Parafrankia colletiae TaxID=573497 RepID=A0A1S1Q4C2_9ACTN|nr:hypothetical protein CC117_28490 [Parafrankia colletiae]
MAPDGLALFTWLCAVGRAPKPRGGFRDRWRGSAAEDLARQLRESDLIIGAMTLAALILMLFFPCRYHRHRGVSPARSRARYARV